MFRKFLLYIILSIIVILGFSIPSFANVKTVDTAPEVNVAHDVVEAINSSTNDSAEVLIELKDYNVGELQSKQVRDSMENDQSEIISDASLEQNETTTYNRLPVVATTVDAVQLKQLQQDDRIKSISLQRRYSLSDIEQNNMSLPSLSSATTTLNASGAWNNSTPYTGTGQKIVIVDTGVENTHPFLAGSVVQELCFAKGATEKPVSDPNAGSCPGGHETEMETGTPNACVGFTHCYTGSNVARPCTTSASCYHGTHVAGIAAGRRSVAGAPTGGIAPTASIIAIKVFGDYTGLDPYGDPYCGPNPADEFVTCILAENTDILKALQWVIANSTNVAAVNLSLGGGSYTSQCDQIDPSLSSAISNLRNTYKIASVVASGNSNLANSIGQPACFSNAIAVGATNKSGTLNVANYSNTSSQIALFAPGSSIISSIPGGLYTSMNGTSMAAPMISGAFALLRQAKPSETITQLLTRLQNSGLSVTDSKNTSVTRKVPNILEAINYIPPSAPSTPSSPGYLSATALHGYVNLSWPAVPGATTYKIITNTGATVVDLPSSTTSYNVPSTPYISVYYAVRAANAAGASTYKYSNTVVGIPSNDQVGYTFFANNGAAVGLGSATPSTSGATGANIVGGSSNRFSNGAWGVTAAGDVQAYGYAGYFGSMGGHALNKPMISIASTASSNGYWMVASDGGIFSFGDAQFYGSTGSLVLNKPVVGMAPTPSGNGYWMVASDGGIFSFGDAQFYGSTGSIVLNKPIVGMTPTPTGNGYWLVASDGGIFAFGDAGFFGSLGGQSLSSPVIGMKRNDAGSGYWIFASDGGVFSFGSAPYLGNAAGRGLRFVQAG